MKMCSTRMFQRGAVTAALTLAFGMTAYADHCNSYRGPAGQVPPSGRAPSDPTPPAGGGGATPGAPSPTGTTPTAPTGPAGLTPGGVPRPANGPRGVTPGRGRGRTSSAEGFERWEFWWEYNKDALLNIRNRMANNDTSSGSADFFLGSQDRTNAHNVVRPTERLVQTDVVPALIKALDDDYYLVRDAAVIALGKIGDASAYNHVVKMLADEHREVQESAALALGLLGKQEATPILVSIMNDDDAAHKITGRREVLTRVRAFAAVGLGVLGDVAAVDPLIKVMNGKEANKDVQVCAAVALGLLQSTDSVASLTQVLVNSKHDDFVRAFAATSLGKIGDASSIPVLVDALRDDSIHVSRSAVVALGLMGGEATDRAIAKVADVAEKSRDPQAKNWAMITLGRLGGKEAFKTLVQALHKEQRSTQAFAALGLALYGMNDNNPQTADEIRKELRDVKDGSVRGAFAIALGLMDDKKSESDLLAMVEEKGNPEMSGYAAVGLGLMQARNTIPTLQKTLSDTNLPDLQRQVSIGLGLMGDRNIVGQLSKILGETKNETILSAAALSLGVIGDHSAVAPLLQYVTKSGADASDTARAYAATALGLLGENTEVPKLSFISRDLNYRAQTEAIRVLLGLL